MKKLTKALSSITLIAATTLTALPIMATPVFAEGGLTCEVKAHEDGSTYVECTDNRGVTSDNLAEDAIFQETVQQARDEWEAAHTPAETPAPVEPEQPVEEYVPTPVPATPTPAPVEEYVPTPVPATQAPTTVPSTPAPTQEPTVKPSTPKPTEEPIPEPVGGEYHSYTEKRYQSDGRSYYCTISWRDTRTVYERIPWNNEKGYIILGHFEKYPKYTKCSLLGGTAPEPVNIPLHEASSTAKPTATPTAKPSATPTAKPTATPTAKPTATPTAKPSATPTAKPSVAPTAKPSVAPTATPTISSSSNPTSSTWNFDKVSNSLLTLINNQRATSGIAPLQILVSAVSDANQRANESMEYAKEVTAYGTTSDGHKGFDTETADTEVNSFLNRLSADTTEEDLASAIFANMTSGVTTTRLPFSAEYKTVGIGFASAAFTSIFGKDLGNNIWFNLQLNK